MLKQGTNMTIDESIIILNNWEEVKGKVKSIDIDQGYVEFDFGRLYLPNNILTQVSERNSGSVVSILKTESLTTPYRFYYPT